MPRGERDIEGDTSLWEGAAVFGVTEDQLIRPRETETEHGKARWAVLPADRGLAGRESSLERVYECAGLPRPTPTTLLVVEPVGDRRRRGSRASEVVVDTHPTGAMGREKGLARLDGHSCLPRAQRH